MIALIPARGGSKGIPGKNMYKLEGKTLVERAVMVSRNSDFVDKTYVSTDDVAIYEHAKELECTTGSLRPEYLATDNSRTIDVIRNLVETEILNYNDCICLLQPTTPLRNSKQLDNVCKMLEAKWECVDAVVSVCEINGPHPYKAQTIQNGYMTSLLGSDSTVPRQSLPKVLIPNGAFYVGKISALLDEDSCTPKRTMVYEMSEFESINLDSPLDLLLLETVVSNGYVRFEKDGAAVGDI